ncbi:DHA2 family efflux MFS transporter permease subunit [Companilactobacillus baiquanensis]|uniref:DHA2 family efflux MFS transporter permease subunit n=1 Tax=Companilactobacillus baiquanensis TaxID=2486005 RepID=A0ABW1UWV5_9LACO|nr:DHA2 family efflux MFS transporter permease subunit [Companilactobacillus baiquanensis]
MQLTDKTKNNDRSRSSIIKTAIILVLGALAPMLDTTMTNVAINTIMKDLHSSVNLVQWITTSYILALGIVVPIAGWAVDHFSGKKIYLIALSVFLIGSIISGISNSIGILIIGRVIQGTGAGIIISIISTLVVRDAGSQGLGSIMAIIGLPAVLAPILGPTFGGFIIKTLNWHWIFYINIPIALASIILIFFMMPKFDPNVAKRNFDWASIIFLGGAFTSLILGITRLSTNGKFTHLNVLGPIILGIVLLISYVIYAKIFPKKALVSLKLFKFPSFTASSILLLLSGLTVNGAMFILPLYLQNIRGLTVIMSGIYLISQGLGLLIARSQIGKLTDQIGARWVVLGSIIIAVIGTLPFAFFNAQTSDWAILITLFIRGIAQGGMTIPVMSDAYTGLPTELISEATTASRMMQNIGGAFGTALLATWIQTQLNGEILTPAHLNSAYQGAFVVTVIMTVLAVIPAWFLSHHISKN